MADGRTGYLVFVTTPERDPSEGLLLTAREVVARCAAKGLWPVGRNGSIAKRFATGDCVLFYAAGSREPERSCFIGTATVTGRLTVSYAKESGGWSERLPPMVGEGTLRTGTPRLMPVRDWSPSPYHVGIGNLALFAKAVPVKPLVSDLEFFSNKEHWGARLAGAFHRMTERDFNLVLERAQRLQN